MLAPILLAMLLLQDKPAEEPAQDPARQKPEVVLVDPGEQKADPDFMLNARKIPDGVRPFATHVYSGEGWVRGQLLEGWDDMDSGGGWPIESVSRAIFAVPAAPRLRVFLSLYVPPVEPFPTVTLKASLNEVPLGSVPLGREQDQYFEWAVPSGAVTGSRAALTLEFHPPQESLVLRVRALGIYAPSEAEQREEDPATVTFRRLQRQHQEAVSWTGQLEACLQQADKTYLQQADKTQELNTDLEAARAELEAARADLGLIFGSRWYRLGKKLRLSPVPASDQKQGAGA